MENKIRKIYNDPKIGLIGVNAFYEKLIENGIDIDIDEIKRILSKEESYTLYKPTTKKFQTRKVIANYVFEQLQADLAFMPYSKENNNIKYLLTIIDVLSKYAWVIPLKDKTGKTLAEKFEPIIIETKPKLLQVDKGLEFYNKHFQDMLKKHNTKMFSTNSDTKAQIVERFNRTLKLRIGKLFRAQSSFRYIDSLDSIVQNYNNTIHSTIKMMPVEAIKPENYNTLINNYNNYNKLNKSKIKYQIGDIVRIPVYSPTFKKEMTGKWTRELFKIAKINKTIPVTYNLIDLNDEPIEGIYYTEELQKVDIKL